jgi:hypothetical protein
MGRAAAGIIKWMLYFVAGMAASFQKVETQARGGAEKWGVDQSKALRNLNARQRKVLGLFTQYRELTSKEIGILFNFQPRTASAGRRWLSGDEQRIPEVAALSPDCRVGSVGHERPSLRTCLKLGSSSEETVLYLIERQAGVVVSACSAAPVLQHGSRHAEWQIQEGTEPGSSPRSLETDQAHDHDG